MMQLDSLSGGVSAASDVASINSVAPKSQTSRLLDQPETSPLSTHNISSGFTSVINWLPNYIVKHRALETRTVSGQNDQTSEDEDYRPFTPPPPRERLSYTRYQLALLNGIYQEVRYPNGTQKQLIAKRVGITREQVKIWFQNRRRKDVVTKVVKSKSSKSEKLSEATGSLAVPSPDIQTVIDNSFEGFSTSGDDSANQTSQNTPCDTQQENELCDTKHQNKVEDTTETSPGNKGSYQQSDSTSVSQIVSPIVLQSMIVELNKFNNEYLKLKKSKKKKKKSKGIKPAPLVSAPTKLSSLPSFSSLSSCQAPRLFQSYDMVAPPNKLTPTANTTLHASETSAFRNPRNQSSISSRLWDHLNSADFLQPYCSLESLRSPDLSHNSISTSSAGSAPSNSLSQTPLHQQTLHLDSSLELQSPSMTARLDHVISANRQFHTVMAPQAAPSSSHLLHRQDLGFSSSAMMSESNNVFQPSPTVPQSLSLQRHHTSHFPSINRVYPFPLVAEPPIMLSNIKKPSVMLSNISQPSVMLSSISQNESYLQNAAWQSISAQTTAPPGPLLPEDSYRPLLISSLNNPYFGPTTHSSSHSPTPATTRWPPSQTLTSDLNNNQFTQL